MHRASNKMSIVVTTDYHTVERDYNIFVARSNLKPEEKYPKSLVQFFGSQMTVPFYRGLSKCPHYFDDIKPGMDWNTPPPNVILTPDQEVVASSIVESVTTKRCCIVSCPPGFGKTFTTLATMAVLKKGRVMIVANRSLIIGQWISAIKTLYPLATTHLLKTEDDVNTITADFILASIQTLRNFNRLIKVDVLICDEVHALLSYKQALSLLRVSTQKLIGLSATPFRYDDYHVVIEYMFGKEMIGVPFEPRPHIVFKINTGIRYPLTYIQRGGKKLLDYNALLEEQSKDMLRTQSIIDCITQPDFAHVRWLIVVKREAHVTAFIAACGKNNVTVDQLVGSKNNYNPHAQVIVGTMAKIGTGFDEPSRNGLVIAADTLAYYTQLHGRVFRNPSEHPVIFDFVDDLYVFEKHYKTRLQTYLINNAKVYEKYLFES